VMVPPIVPVAPCWPSKIVASETCRISQRMDQLYPVGKWQD
jgi:hypothetical protein